MILDGALMFDNPASLAIAAGTQVSTNTLDLLNARDLGNTDTLALFAQVTATFTSGGAGTLQWSFQGSVDNSAWNTYVSSRVFALAELIAGAQLAGVSVPLVPVGLANPRYLRLLWTVGTATMTAGSVTAGILLDRQRNIAYAPGISITN